MKSKSFCLLLLFISLLGLRCTENCAGSKAKVVDLKCRGLVTPEGIDEAVFSWKIESEENGFIQSAWEIEVASSREDLQDGNYIWNSGKTVSEQQVNVRPDIAILERGPLYWWRLRIWDGKGQVTVWSEPSFFSLGLNTSDWKAKWITSVWKKDSPMPYFRKVFDTGKAESKLQRAVVYFCGLGCGDLYLNGELVDKKRILDPAQTNYEQYALYSTFDITSGLVKGENCLGVILGEGWYGQNSVWGPWAKYGDPLFRLQMEITYEDGSKEMIVSDESWLWTSGPVLKGNIYAGEVYDATKEIKGWSEVGTQLNGWKNAVVAEGVIPVNLFPHVMESICLKNEIRAVKKWKDPSGNWIFDFGVNIAGVPQITVNQPKGTHLKMRMGELLREDGSIEYNTTGVFATGVVQTDEYICAGNGREVWNPRFTYHGYRYLELSGLAAEPELDWIKTIVVHTDVNKRGEFECSDEQINKLHELAVRTMLNNTHGLPTDCPHRERCGWLGDAHTVAPFENYNFDLNNFWMKYMEDISSTSSAFEKNTLHQKLFNTIFYFADKAPGIPYMISPGKRLCGVASPDWGTAVVQLPWYTYLYFGNEEPLHKYYQEMKQWVDHVESLTLNDTLSTKHIVPYGLGDWCPPEGNNAIDCPVALSSTAFHYLDASILAKTAAILGKNDDAGYYSGLKDKIAAAFVAEFYDKESTTFGSQTADAMALDFGLVPAGDEKAVSDAIVRNMKEKYDGFMHTGIFGLGRIGQALSRFGNSKMAWDMFTKTGENSFAYMWTDADATSLWEILPVNGKSKEMCLAGSSLNHPMQGGYDTWFYEDIAGIRPDVSGPGFKVIHFEPTMTSYLSWAKASIETPYGRTASEWSQEENSLVWIITLPPNTSGIVALPDSKKIHVNKRSFNKADYPLIGSEEEVSLYKFPSGVYQIEIYKE
ncbi:family 78 glycoside hydrolase catalytic domain [Parabacteroides segnis]|jgi:alpha-L-rhamnosidase|uniref:alpha-L-rhamnosidase n=1 Tax=Parabacteroides segnis TaxID=2763058 RepID=A0ABR7DWQ0_9BACT|nr:MULTISPECIES: alpha-L-rhamnosidase [Parabacteroides]MBC5641917.1 family 78 glycoside hydrolase catalytic domain [Parabacteroides segnis]MCM0712292.1 glycoside hydrolase family 78 protein [Parabacteroides sp. TA-V-105]